MAVKFFENPVEQKKSLNPQNLFLTKNMFINVSNIGTLLILSTINDQLNIQGSLNHPVSVTTQT